MMPFKAFTKKYDDIVSQIILPCEVSKPVADIAHGIDMTTFDALWDTGASCSAISKRAATLLKLVPVSVNSVYHANGRSMVNLYDISFILPNKTLFPHVTVVEVTLSDFDLLIGMDIISQGDLSISNKDGKTTFSFRLPSYKEIDFLKEYDEVVPVLPDL